MKLGERTILHSDMNCFYASVEMMLDPSLRGKPVAVCGSTENRHGIVLAKSELAKRAGVKTGMVNWEARQCCPNLIMVKPQYDQYLKSELAAAVALLLCCGDGEQRAEIYGCAADRGQATIVFDVAADMVRMCPALNKRCKILASQKRIIYTPTNSFYQVLSAEAYSKHGFNIHGVVFDELHTQPNRKLFDVMTKGSGDARMQPLYFLITTAGTDTNSITACIQQVNEP